MDQSFGLFMTAIRLSHLSQGSSGWVASDSCAQVKIQVEWGGGSLLMPSWFPWSGIIVNRMTTATYQETGTAREQLPVKWLLLGFVVIVTVLFWLF